MHVGFLVGCAYLILVAMHACTLYIHCMYMYRASFLERVSTLLPPVVYLLQHFAVVLLSSFIVTTRQDLITTAVDEASCLVLGMDGHTHAREHEGVGVEERCESRTNPDRQRDKVRVRIYMYNLLNKIRMNNIPATRVTNIHLGCIHN